MRRKRNYLLAAASAAVFVLTAFAGAHEAPARADRRADDKDREYYQAQAYGTGTQMGRTVNVSILINRYSPPDDQKILLNAFTTKGMQGLTDALSKMKSKGRISITGTLGYDLSYIRTFKTEQGRTIRMVTDRPISFAEAWEGTRSLDYSMSAAELNLNDEESKSTGTLLPLCKLSVNKEKGLEIEAFQNPWTLRDIQKR